MTDVMYVCKDVIMFKSRHYRSIYIIFIHLSTYVYIHTSIHLSIYLSIQADRGQVLRDGGAGPYIVVELRDDPGGRLVRDTAAAGRLPLLPRPDTHGSLLPRDMP